MLTPLSARVTLRFSWQMRIMASLVMIPLLLGPAQVYAQSSSRSVLQSIEQEIISLVKQVEPSIVSVIAQRRVITTLNGQPFSGWDSGIGSGVVIHSDGYIITTGNVVDGADRIIISFPDGQHRAGELIGIDPLSEIAVIHVDSVTSIPVQMGDSDEVYPGAWAIIMGNAYGLPSSVSFGLVNGIRSEDGLLQVSALINPGATGGAVFSTDGKVIGLIAAELAHTHEPISYGNSGSIGRLSQLTGQASGAVLVIPVNRVKSFTHQLIEYGEVRRSWLGIDVEQTWLSINMGGSFISLVGSSDGLQITSVVKGSPAQEADLRVGDRILAVNGISMSHPIRLAEYVTTIPAGVEIEIRYLRDNREGVTFARLVLRSEQPDSSAASILTSIPPDEGFDDQEFPMGKTLQWLMELELEVQHLKQQYLIEQSQIEEQPWDEQMRQVNQPSRP